MGQCEACGSESDHFLYTCNECGKTLCSDHRLPENHLCGIRDRIDDSRQSSQNFGSGAATSPVEGADARAECKTDDCTNTSEPDSRFCPDCLNRQSGDDRDVWAPPLSEDTARTCERPTCSNAVSGSATYCLDCRREKANSSSGPAVETTNGSPYNSAGQHGAVPAPERSPTDRARVALKRARVHASNAFWTIVGLVLLPFVFLKRTLGATFRFFTSTAGVLVLVIGIGALAAGPLGIVSVNDSAIDDVTSDVSAWVNDTAPEPTDEETPTDSTADDDTGGVVVWLNDTDAEATDGQPLNESIVQQLIHEEVNERRENHGASPIEYSQDLENVARFHATDMLRDGYFAHDAPNGSGPGDRYDRRGIACSYGENIAMTHAKITVLTDDGSEYYETNEGLARGIVNQWMNSTGHRENILRPRFYAEGIGVRIVEDADSDGLVVYAVQNFCGPRSSPTPTIR